MSNQRKSSKDGAPKRAIVADYEVGKWKPPEKYRFAPKTSGNPRGRPRKPKVGERGLDYFLSEVLVINMGKGPERFTKRELMYAGIANKAVKGDARAVSVVLQSEAANENRKTGEPPVDPLLFDSELTRELVNDLQQELTAQIEHANRLKEQRS